MKRPHRVPAPARIEPEPLFRVVMLYDDFIGGKRAMDTCHFLAAKIGGGVELRSSMWKFDVLRSPKLNEIAVQDAIEADVIIVATARNGGLPPEMEKWVKIWAPLKRGQAAALVALLDASGEDAQAPAQAGEYLKGVATVAGIDFLAQAIRSGQRIGSPNSAAPQSPLSSQAFDLPSGRPSPEAWGLND